MSDVVTLKGSCPLCKRPGVEGYLPFCSKGCQARDLNQWLSGGYRVPSEESPPFSDNDGEAEQA